MGLIKKVIPREEFHLEVELENGSSVVLNLQSRLQTVRFGLLADKTFFCRVVTDGYYIRWDDKIEVSYHEIFQLAQK